MARPLFVTDEQDEKIELAHFLEQYWPPALVAKLVSKLSEAKSRVTRAPEARRRLVETRYRALEVDIERLEKSLSSVIHGLNEA